VVDVRPYVPLEVAAIAEEALSGEGFERFEAGVRLKVEALGSRFVGTTVVGNPDPGAAEHAAREALERLVRERRVLVVLVGGVSAGDPLSPFFAALESLGGRVLRRGVPAHPGSMIWLAEMDGSRLLGLPQCGMFSMATAADLVLPRLLTGEALTAADLADLAHGGVLGREMRFRFPDYARDLQSPEG
jgi:molybdopterin biosynthesis enzyme